MCAVSVQKCLAAAANELQPLELPHSRIHIGCIPEYAGSPSQTREALKTMRALNPKTMAGRMAGSWLL